MPTPRASTPHSVMERRRRGPGWRLSTALAACSALLFPVACSADKAAFSLDLMGTDSATAYTLTVTVGSGSKANSFRLIADTGSSNDAVLGSGCCGSDANVTYSCDASSTCSASNTEVSLAFAGASIAGHFVSDVWSSSQIGSITKDFLVIDEQDTFYRSEYDGITGLAYKALGKPTGSPKTMFYENLVASKSGTADTFGMLLCGIMQPLLVQDTYSMHAGQLLIGGTDGLKGETYYKGPMLYTPIAQEAWYVVIISDVGFDGQSLGLPCSSYNEPQAIIDSGTSNIAFPSDVYNALMAQIKAATKKAVPTFSDSYFDYRKSCCGKDYCDPSDNALALLKLPSIYITLAMQDDSGSDTKSHYTVEIPPEYYFRPEMNGNDLDVACRAIGIAEGSAIVLGDVFMDGLYAYHDRTKSKIGLALADNCPNGVNSTKKVSVTTSKTDDWCDCFSSTLKAKSSLVRYFPWGSGCFFMPWWLYVVIASGLVVVICIGILGYWWWTGRQEKEKAATYGAPGLSAMPVTITGGSDTTTTRSNTNDSAYSAMADRKDVPPSNPSRQPPSQQQHYARMSSPREWIEPASSYEPSAHGSAPSTREHSSGRDRKNSDRSTASSTGFLL